MIYSADDKLAKKLTRDTLQVLRHHPLCAGMLPPGKPGALEFWVTGAGDARNASMSAVGVNSNAVGSRADDCDFDDIEVVKNIKSPEARAALRQKIEDVTHILVPGWQKTFIGTPHTHNSIYTEQIEGGAESLKIPLFEHATRYEQTDSRLKYAHQHKAREDGIYVFAGIGKFARLLREGFDYRVEGYNIVFAEPPRVVIDIYTGCIWPERFTRAEIELKRKETKTLNAWDSQYMLEAKPLTETRLNPDLITPYDVEPEIRVANRKASMWLGHVRIAGMSCRWDPSAAKKNSDVSAVALVLQDEHGRRYLHRSIELTGEVAQFNERADRITGGQVFQLCDLIEKFNIPRVVIETNGVGAFAGNSLKACLRQRHLTCGVKEVPTIANKNGRILEAYEPILGSRMLWAHTSVMSGPFADQLRDFNPDTQNQADDHIDAGAAAIADTPERIKVKIPEGDPAQKLVQWRPASGVRQYEIAR